MTTTQRGLLTLIRSSVTGEALPLEENFSISEAESLIRQHNMVSLVYEGAILCGISRTEDPMPKLFRKYCMAAVASDRQLENLKRLTDAFEEAGVDYMPLKGSRMKYRYPKPEMRTMGDADILIRMEQYPQIRPLLAALGYAEKEESDHELIWKHPGLYLELHKRLIPSYNRDFYGYFGDGWRLARREQGCRWGMTPEDEWIYLFTHYAKHYRDGGIGCRHVTDLWVFLRTFPELDWQYIRHQLQLLELKTFHDHTLRLIDWWFRDGEGDDCLALMTEYIFSSGSFGTSDSRLVSQMLSKVENAGHATTGRRAFLRQTLFPGVEALKGRWPILKKAPWLLPVIWLIRPMNRFLRDPKILRQKTRQLQVVSGNRVDQRRKSLELVGLDFRF